VPIPAKDQRSLDSTSSGFDRAQVSSALCRVFLWCVIIAPVLFFFLVVQYSAITFPFWDHCEFILDFAKLHDHTFRINDLWAAHNHSRPLTLTTIVLLNGLVTDWDIRSEYVYLLSSVIAGFAIQAYCIKKIAGRFNLTCLASTAALSVISFSPAGHNNHWWSFMIQLDLAHALIAFALVCICMGLRSWQHNVIAALACWAAAYTISNGLVAFAVAIVIVQLVQPSFLRLTWLALFWSLNLVLILVIYLPGLAETGPAITDPRSFAEFCLAYLGSPLVSMIAFPYHNMFDVPRAPTHWNEVVGALLLATACLTFVAKVKRKRSAEFTKPELLFVAFSLFAVGSAALTAWGRSQTADVGAVNANASRYTIFSSYLLYAFIYVALDSRVRFAQKSVPRAKGWAGVLTIAVGGAVFLLAAARTYTRSIGIYSEAHRFNNTLAVGFLHYRPEELRFAYPNAERLKLMVAELRRLRIGPYRYSPPYNLTIMDEVAENRLQDKFGVNGIKEDATLGTILFANPPSQFALSVSGNIRKISFDFGILDGALRTAPPTHAVTFAVLATNRAGVRIQLWKRTLDPLTQAGDRGIQHATVALDSPGGSEVIFETTAVTNPLNCWAYWRNIKILPRS